jgi:hypothetical protein
MKEYQTQQPLNAMTHRDSVCNADVCADSSGNDVFGDVVAWDCLSLPRFPLMDTDCVCNVYACDSSDDDVSVSYGYVESSEPRPYGIYPIRPYAVPFSLPFPADLTP